MNQYERLINTREAVAAIIKYSKVQHLQATGAYPEGTDFSALAAPSFTEIEGHLNTIIAANIMFEDVLEYAAALLEAGK